MMVMMHVHSSGSTTNVLALPQEPSLLGSGFVLVSDCSFINCAAAVRNTDWKAFKLCLFLIYTDCQKKRTNK